MKKESLPVRPRPEIIAHRGASGEAPENTLAAIRLAWRQNADAVEVDIHLSRDGRIIVLHDDDTNRVAGVPRPVAEQTLAELQTLDVGVWKDPKFAGEKIPTFQEVLRTIPDGKRMFVEIKCGAEILPELRRVVAESGKQPEQIAWISFSLEICTVLKRTFPMHRVYFLSGFSRDPNTGACTPTMDELILSAQKAHLDGLDLARQGPIQGDCMQKLRAAGLELYVWTVNDPVEAKRLAAAGAAGITTDYPKQLRDAGIGQP